MTIIRALNKVENASLHDAILLTTLVDNKVGSTLVLSTY